MVPIPLAHKEVAAEARGSCHDLSIWTGINEMDPAWEIEYSQAIHSKANSSSNKSRAQRSRDNRASKRSPTLGRGNVYRNVEVELTGHAEGE